MIGPETRIGRVMELEDASVKYDMPLSPLDSLEKQYVQYALASLGVRMEG